LNEDILNHCVEQVAQQSVPMEKAAILKKIKQQVSLETADKAVTIERIREMPFGIVCQTLCTAREFS